MAVTLVQSDRLPEQNSINSTLALPGASADGNTIVVCLNLYGQGGGSDIPGDVGVSDGTNTFIRFASVSRVGSNWGQHVVFYAATDITGLATEAIEATYGENCWNWITAWEVTPSVFDTSVTATGTGIDTSPGTLTPSSDGAFLCSSANFDGSDSLFTADDSDWTFLVNDTAGGGSNYTASKAQTTIAGEPCGFSTVAKAGGTLLWAAIAVSFVEIGPAPSVRLVQAGTTGEQESDNATLTLSSTSDGNTIIVCLNMYGSGDASDIPRDISVGDGTNTFVRIDSSDVQRTGGSVARYGQHIVYYVATDIVGLGTDAIAAVFNEGCFNWVSAWEVTPSFFDTAVTDTGTGNTTSPGTLTPSSDGAFLVSTAQFDGSSVPFTADGPGWTFLSNDTAGDGSMYTASKYQGTIAGEPCSFTTVGDNDLLWAASAISAITLLTSGQAAAEATATVTVGLPEGPLAQATTGAGATGPALITAAALLSCTSGARAQTTATVLSLAPTNIFPAAQTLVTAVSTATASSLLEPTSRAQAQATVVVAASAPVSASAASETSVLVAAAAPSLLSANASASTSAQASATAGGIAIASSASSATRAIVTISVGFVPQLAPTAAATMAATLALATGEQLAPVAQTQAQASGIVTAPSSLALVAGGASQATGLVAYPVTLTAIAASQSSATAPNTVAMPFGPTASAVTSASTEYTAGLRLAPAVVTSTAASASATSASLLAPAGRAVSATSSFVGMPSSLTTAAASATQALMVLTAPLAAVLLLPLYADVTSNRTYVDVIDPSYSVDLVSPRTLVDVEDPSTDAAVILP